MIKRILDIKGLGKDFVLHNQGDARIGVFGHLDLSVVEGDCVVLGGPSGVGKSSLMRAIYGNYLASAGEILVRHHDTMVDITKAPPRLLARIRTDTMGYVSQFLRVIPRVPTLALVMEPMLEQGFAEDDARERAITLLTALKLPEGHWALPPATFSGGEQQRVNIARGFAPHYPLLLLDEPTASLDRENKNIVIDLIRERLGRGAAIVGIFHDEEVRQALDARIFDVTAFQAAA